MLNNTIFMFSSDNGGVYDADGNPTRNLPLREGKGSMYEGGIRVPLMVSWGADPNITPGTRTSARASLYDLYPTIFDLTGLTGAMPPNNPIDGISMRAALEGGAVDRGLLYWHYPHRSNQDVVSAQINGGSFVSAVEDDDWKLLFYYEDRHYELYNLATDIGETTNLLASNPNVAHDLSLALQDYLMGVNAQMPLNRTTGLAVSVPPVLPLPGDYNSDNFVDSRDYVLWRQNPSSFGGASGYDVWRQNFGYTPSIGSGSRLGSTSLAAVPEPATLLLLMLAAAGWYFRRRRYA